MNGTLPLFLKIILFFYLFKHLFSFKSIAIFFQFGGKVFHKVSYFIAVKEMFFLSCDLIKKNCWRNSKSFPVLLKRYEFFSIK